MFVLDNKTFHCSSLFAKHLNLLFPFTVCVCKGIQVCCKLHSISDRISRIPVFTGSSFRHTCRQLTLLREAAARELGRYKLDVVGVQEVRWDKEGSVTTGDYDFFYGKGKENHQLGTGILYTVE